MGDYGVVLIMGDYGVILTMGDYGVVLTMELWRYLDFAGG